MIIDHSLDSPNFDDRINGQEPQFIMLHGTWTADIVDTLAFLTNPDRESRVSAHYAIDTDGTIYGLVDEGKRAWHAGRGFWRGVSDMNSASIGIEIQNDGHAPYTIEQINALASLIRDIQARRGIIPENVIAHSDYAPDRKDDPGAHFPWHALAEEGLVINPDITKASSDMLTELNSGPEAFNNALYGWGYGDEFARDDVLRAFDLRYVPEAFEVGAQDIDTLRAQRLAALWSQKLGG